MADESLAPMTDWRERVWAKYDLVVPEGWPAVHASLIGTPDSDAKPCWPIPCPPFPQDPEVDLPSIVEALQLSAADYRYRYRVVHDHPVVVYVPEWTYARFTDEQRAWLERSGITVRTHL